MAFAYVAAFATALCYGVSAVLEDRAAKATPVTGKSVKRAALRATMRAGYLAGLALSVVAWVLSLVALRRLPLFAVQAIAGSSIGVVVLITWAITGHKPSRREGILLVILGIALVALAASASPGEPRSVSWLFTLLVWIGVLAVAYAAVAATKVAGPRGSALLGGVSGLSDGGMALCARALNHNTLGGFVTDPLALALIPFTVIGIVAFAASLQRGAAAVALACQQAVMAVVPSVIGLLVLGDKARQGYAVVTYAGFAITIGVVVALTFATSPAHPPLVAPAPIPPARHS